MNVAESLKLILKKYDLFSPVPPEVQRVISSAKKETLGRILKMNNHYSLFRKASVSLYFAFNRMGFGISPRNCGILAGAGSLAMTVCTLTLVLLFAWPYMHLPYPAGEATVICSVGDASITRGTGRSALKARDGVKKGDVISTGKDSFVIIQAGHDRMLRLQADTMVEVTSLLEGGNTDLSVTGGKILARILKLGSKESFSVKTRTVIASVRGTAFSVEHKDGSCLIAVKEGAVELTDTAVPGKKIVSAGATAVVEKTVMVRPITQSEKIEIGMIDAVPFQEDPRALDDAALRALEEWVRKNDAEIKVKMDADTGNSLPVTLEDIRRKFGHVDTVVTFQGRKYRGAVISRGPVWTMIVSGRQVRIPVSMIQSSGSE